MLMKTFTAIACRLLSVMLFAVSCGTKNETVRPGFEPPVLLTIDTRKPLNEQQQKERLRMARFFGVGIENDKFVLLNTWNETKNAGIARPYYDYMTEVVEIYNYFATGLDDGMRASYMYRTIEWQENLPEIISREYLRFGEYPEVVMEFTPELAERVGYTKEEFDGIYANMLESKEFVDEHFAYLRSEGLTLLGHERTFDSGMGHSLFFPYLLYMEGVCMADDHIEVSPALLELNRRYMPAERQ